MVLLVEAIQIARAHANAMGIVKSRRGTVEAFDHVESVDQCSPTLAAIGRFMNATAGHAAIHMRRIARISDD